MRHMRFVRSKAGDMGIGAMIVFIAMVLVAGIAASVLVQTANKLQNQAMTTGAETTNEVATGIGVDNICAEKGTYNYGGTIGTVTDKLCNMTISVSPRSGSKDIDLSKVTIEVTNSATKIVLNYTATRFIDYSTIGSAGIFDNTVAAFNASVKSFGVMVLNDADQSCGVGTSTNPVINRGDHVLLTICPGKSFGGWGPSTDIWGMIIPETGAPGIFAFRTPSSLAGTIFDLY